MHYTLSDALGGIRVSALHTDQLVATTYIATANLSDRSAWWKPTIPRVRHASDPY